MIRNTANLSALFTSYKGNFSRGFGRATPKWPSLATQIPSSTAQNLYGFLGQWPQLREWIGDLHIKDLKANDYTLINKKFESTVSVNEDQIDDDTYGVFAPMFDDMGYASAMHPDSLVFAALAAGATGLCYDGQAFFDASHPVVVNEVESTVSNYDATGGGNLWCLMDTKRPLKPLIWQTRKPYKFVKLDSANDQNVFMTGDYLYGVRARAVAGYGLWQMAYGSLNTLNSTNVDTYMQAGFALKGDEGHPLNIYYDTLVFGPSNWAAARALVEHQKLANGADNPYYKAFKLVMSHYLT
ncbi:MAG: Mu-like prophage major head subunit gpT family protein [Phycisphaerales bacterium]|jgi:phage major head subunit gpT-like protein